MCEVGELNDNSYICSQTQCRKKSSTILMKNRFHLDSNFSWFCSFIAAWVLMVSSLGEASSELHVQMAKSLALSVTFLLIVLVAWVCRQVNHGDYPIIGIKKLLIVLGTSYILPLFSLLFWLDRYWIYAFALQLLLIVSLWVGEVSKSQKS